MGLCGYAECLACSSYDLGGREQGKGDMERKEDESHRAGGLLRARKSEQLREGSSTER
jgi:hypothetical protein